MEITIRKADRRHLADINRIITDAKISDPLDKLPRLFWFVRVDGRIVACAGGEFIDETTFIILHIAVEKPYKRQHVGISLLDHVMAYAREHGATDFGLLTMFYSFAFFRQRGFDTCGGRKNLPDNLRNHPMFIARRYMKCAAMIT
ncbi:MAG: GNAT family N-acetyltransferase [Patescibacteria group bacterium]|nr:GNAT family N-acetyltransferase [Patescibacteria group bacterium]